MRYYAVLAHADDTCPFYSSPVNETATPRTSSESENCKECIKTNPENWAVLKDGDDGRTIDPILYTGESEESSVKLTDAEVAGLKDDNGDIWLSKVMDWCFLVLIVIMLTMVFLVLKDLVLVFGNGKQ